MRNYILLGISILSGIAAFVITRDYIESEKRKLDLLGAKKFVLAFNKDKFAGDTIKYEDMRAKAILQRNVTERMIELPTKIGPNGDPVVTQITQNEMKLLIDKRVLNTVAAGEPVLVTDVEAFQRANKHTFSQTIHVPDFQFRHQNHYRAVSIAVDNTSSVSGLIEHNDFVDVIATFRFPNEQGTSRLDTITMTILQKVSVLATGQEHARQPGNYKGRRVYSTITLSVTPHEAELLVFAQQKGKITFTLRNPLDAKYEENLHEEGVNFDYLKPHIKEYMKKRKKDDDERL